ncbi:MAG TPA: hypothetical protein DEQ87_19225 [Algoriphagus sp.]|uniref:hypothetical protein n=2 Tax=Algoriphagus TaxID=246875 RepID=UPI000C4EC3A7|nr:MULTISPECIES: hypothetical protein [unclassified Algoriphagus]MAL11957.1 hypothetical protein [Algoriphagus sp.]MAN87417.1 hypothetical protein [Algoriphagus sp.]QYH38625.1 hypothetical protein GYM62_07385 [Algoriphagus sp. NBT04N3]HAD53459.1 hypothetical protein [Algoriphagus sp.]HAH36061.1 hypothetical protein [Algoriphagus sp.]
MLPISLIILGGILLISGIVLLVKSKSIKNESLTQAIAAVKADGILTPKEEKLILEIAKIEGKDGNATIAKIRRDLEESEEDSETELIDVNQKAGLDFEKFVVQKFDKKYFKIRNWAGDKFVDGRYADTTTQPDIQLSLILRGQSYPLAVECKWRSEPNGNFIRFAKDGQLERYKAFAQQENYPVFIALGIGGKPSSPAELYILPIQELKKPILHKAGLGKYRKKIDSDFFFDQESNNLR